MTLTMRTIKITLATVLSIWIAYLFQLENSLSAGIIAILSVLDTKKASVGTAVDRFLSTLLALGIATLLFTLFGYEVLIFGGYLAIYVPIAYRFNLQSGIAPCSVLVTHLLLAESVAFSLLMNEILLMVIGAGIAIVFNLYMPDMEKELKEFQRFIEEDMKQLLRTFNTILRREYVSIEIEYDVEQVTKQLDESYRLAVRESDNYLFGNSLYFVHYFQMRRNQVKLLRQMSQNLQYINLTTEQSRILGRLFDNTADELHVQNTGKALLEDVDALHQRFREMNLPGTREEFESRAILYQLMLDFKEFLQLKNDFARSTSFKHNKPI